MKTPITILISFLLAGCATNLTSMPISEENYSLGKKELVQQYPDIAKYEEKWRGLIPDVITQNEVTEHLGEPVRIEREWWYPTMMVGALLALNAGPAAWGIVLATRPDTPKKVYFQKHGYCVEAQIDRTILNLYEPIMWSWSEDQTKCEH